MLSRRVIPVLLLSNGELVKTQAFSNPVYVGDPLNAVRIFNEKRVDEIMVLGVDETARVRGPDFSLISEIAAQCFMPLSYGGGIRDMADVQRLQNEGVEKVVVRSAFFRDPAIVRRIAEHSGSQSVAVCIDISAKSPGTFEILTPEPREYPSPDLARLVENIQHMGAGEIVIQFVAHDGQMNGLDLAVTKSISSVSDIPVVAVGGVGSLEDIRAGLDSGASAVGAGSFFVFHGPRRAVLITYPSPSEISRLRSGV